MRSRDTFFYAVVTFASCAFLLGGLTAKAQSNQYKRPQKKAASPAKAGAGKTESAAKKSGDKLDISDLENKYWAPKDTDFSVVQNRTYSKKGRYSVTLNGGNLINDRYSEGLSFGVTGNYFFDERMGVEVSYVNTNSVNNELTNNFRELSTNNGSTAGVLPDHSKVKSYYGVGFNWVPFYAKMSVLGKKIIYFDMAFTPGIGVTQYEQQVDTGNKMESAISLSLDITQFFFFSESFALRADLKNRWFQEKVLWYATPQRGTEKKTNTNNTSLFMFGLTYFF